MKKIYLLPNHVVTDMKCWYNEYPNIFVKRFATNEYQNRSVYSYTHKNECSNKFASKFCYDQISEYIFI